MLSLKAENYSPPQLERALLLSSAEPAPAFRRLKLRAPAAAGAAGPGQFVMVFPPGGAQRQMLPRPFSLFRAEPEEGTLELLFSVRGRGTALLAGCEPGTPLDLLGPLGRGFPPPERGALLVAGGMGIAPLAFLAASSVVESTIIYGVRSAGALACSPRELARPGLTVLLASDDGSAGVKGSAFDLARGRIAAARAVYACGPLPLLKEVAAVALEAKVPAFVSVEEGMACGIGACLGCAVETANGYARVCREGPVFPAGEVTFGD